MRKSCQEARSPQNEKSPKFKKLLPIIREYVKQHLPDLKEKTKGGKCIGFAVTLARSIGENRLNVVLTALDKLLDMEEDFKLKKTTQPDAEISSVIRIL